jgi:hypothetical protein
LSGSVGKSPVTKPAEHGIVALGCCGKDPAEMNRRLRFGWSASALIVAFLAAAAVARADFAAMAVTADPLNTFNDHLGYSLGYEFKMSSTQTVSQLGYFDNGLITESHSVGIYAAGGTLLISATVSSTDPLTANFRYHSIAPITLTAGQTYFIAGVSGIVDDYAFTPIAFSSDPSVKFVSSAYVQSTTLAFPKAIDGQIGYFGPQFHDCGRGSRTSDVLVVGRWRHLLVDRHAPPANGAPLRRYSPLASD